MEALSPASRVDLARALRQTAITALIAFGLLLPLIGFNTVQNIHNELVLETRWPLLAVLVAIIAAGRFLHAIFISRAGRYGRAKRTQSARQLAHGACAGLLRSRWASLWSIPPSRCRSWALRA